GQRISPQIPGIAKECPAAGCTDRAKPLYDRQDATIDHTPGETPRHGMGRHLMAHPNSQAEAPATEPVATSPEKATLLGTLVHLWPYIWPGDRDDLKMRVVWSMVLLLIAKLATLSVPFTLKWAIDALSGANTAPVEASNWMLWLIASPLLMT